MGFFGEEVSAQRVELQVPELYSLRLLQACLAPTTDADAGTSTAEVTTLFVQTANEESGFALCSLGGSKSQPVRFCSLQHEFGPEDCPLVLYTDGGKIHLTGSWSWTSEADDMDDDEDDDEDECCDEDGCDDDACCSHGGECGQGSDEVGDSEEDEEESVVETQAVKAVSTAKSSKRKREEEREARAEQQEQEMDEAPVKKTTRNKRGGKQEPEVVPANELVAVSKPPPAADIKAWKVKPQNSEGLPVPTPKQKTLKTGVLVTDYVVGNGAEPKLGSLVKITYEGMFPNGKVFDKNGSRKKPLKFRVGSGQVIRGLDLGMDKMRVGGSREIVIPPALGYGKDGIGDIPGNQVLVFRITLVGMEKKSLSKR
jgi:FK506-binding nuclear protein